MQSVIYNFLYLNMLMDIYTDPSNYTTESSPVTTKVSTTTAVSNQTEIPNVCYTLYGKEVCFSKVEASMTDSRPIEKMPQTPDYISTVFTFHFRGNETLTVIDPTIIDGFSSNAKYSRKSCIKIIIHGYKSSAIWFMDLASEFLRSDEVEFVITVDWYNGSILSYAQSVANIRLVGIQTAMLIHQLMEQYEIPTSSFHTIGHSLGAHLLGYCGTYLKSEFNTTLSRISGLDPAGPFFQDNNPSIRLDPTDADFVDVIHTDNSYLLGFPLTIGLTDPVGHLDFYPNGGSGQPECGYSSLHCQHIRASKLYIESIRQSCTFIGVVCPSYELFLKGDCWDCDLNICSPMGLKAAPLANRPPNSKLFLMTYGNSPYCGIHYRITVHSSNGSYAWYNGGEFASIGIDLIGARDTTGEIALSDISVLYDCGLIHRKVIFTDDVGKLIKIVVHVHNQALFFNSFWAPSETILYLESIDVERLYPPTKLTFCFGKREVTTSKKFELTSKDLC